MQSDVALLQAVRRTASDADGVLGSLKDLGELGGTAEAREHGMLANRNEPVLETFDRFGQRISEVGWGRGENIHLDAAVHEVLAGLADLSHAEGAARRLAARMATCLQGALLVGGDDPEVATAPRQSRAETATADRHTASLCAPISPSSSAAPSGPPWRSRPC